MNRGYTREHYLEKIDKLRKHCPGIAITSDIIVGFPGETKTDFKKTLDLISKVEFDGLFAFKYSDRPNASSSGFPEKVSETEKKERLERLLSLQENFTKKSNIAMVGKVEKVLVEGYSKRQDTSRGNHSTSQWSGRTSTNKIVNFIQDDDSVYRDGIFEGRLVDVIIEKALSHSLLGKVATVEPLLYFSKGEECYAA